MDKVLLFTTIYCFLIFPFISNAFRGQNKHNSNDFQWNLEIMKDLNMIPNRNRSDFRKEFILEKNPKFVATECCQTIEEIIQPKGGVSKNGRILELYRDDNSTQNFFQISCKDKGRRCGRHRITKHWLNNFECIQKYSFTYALVREFNAPESSPWRLDYIRIRNGCSCERIK